MLADDRFCDTDADRHEDISRNGSSGFGGSADSATADLIPSPTDQNPWAHWRNPMDMMRQG